MSAARLANQLWRRVHPDLFARWPTAQAVNEKSMQSLRGLLDAADENQAALRSGAALRHAAPPNQEVRFFVVHDEVAAVPLREVSALWRSPPIVHAVSREKNAEAWFQSAESCVKALLREIDQDAPSDEPPIADGGRRGEYDEHVDAASDVGMVRAATQAAERRRQREKQDHRRRAPAYDPEADLGGGAELRPSMLFFHQVPFHQRAEAKERLAEMIGKSLPEGAQHGPVLVCGRLPPPPDAAESGFACVSLESLLGAGGSPAFGPRHLRQALRAAEESSGGQRAAARQAEGDWLIESSRQLRKTLGCEGVRWDVDLLSNTEASAICQVLLPHAPALRAALDNPWAGLFLDFEPATAAGSADSHRADFEAANARIVDASGGGGALVLRGAAGAADALRFVQGGGWRELRYVQRRHQLARELRERLGCRAVEAMGAPRRTAAQCATLAELLNVLRVQPVLLSGRRKHASGVSSDDHLGEVTVTVGAPIHEEADADLDPWGQLEPNVLRLPDSFDPAHVLRVLETRTQAAIGRTPSVRKRKRAGRRR